jgi:hypothetical protein
MFIFQVAATISFAYQKAVIPSESLALSEVEWAEAVTQPTPVGEAGLSIPLRNLQVSPRDPSTSLRSA